MRLITPVLSAKRFLVPLSVLAGMLVSLSPPATLLSHVVPKQYEPICEIWLDPHDKFTRVVPDSLPRVRLDANAALITVNYTGFPPQAQSAFQHAVNIWQSLLTSNVPTVVNATFQDLGHPLLLGSAGPVTVHRNFSNAPRINTWFNAALANKIAGFDLGADVEIVANFNSTASWYFGTDGLTPSGQVDFVSVVLHELAHGLGFTGGATVSNGIGTLTLGATGSPLIYSAFTIDGAGNSLLTSGLYPEGSAGLAAVLQSDNVFWTGANARAANAGAAPKLHAPATWAPGSSYAHLDEATYPAGNPHSLMTPGIGSAEAIHSPGGITLGIFADQGWTTAAPCNYTLSVLSAAVPQAGVSGASVAVTTSPGCAWTATSNNPSFITITGGTSGNGSGTVTYNVGANPSTFRTGTMAIAGQTFTVAQDGIGPTMAIDRTFLAFGAVSTGAAFVAQTAPQLVRLTQTGAGNVPWTATSTQPWLQVSPASGTGPANLTISVVHTPGLPASGAFGGAISLAFTGSGNSPGPIVVTLTTMPSGSSAAPFGVIETPLENSTNVTGAVPFTGWGLDDVQAGGVAICRAAVAGEGAPIDPRCGGAAQIFVGDAVFIEGARPDVQTAFPAYPDNHRAGWGLMVLTNMLPAQGNGTYTFFFYLRDVEGHTVLLGTRTLVCNNANAVKPFGAIDTPSQGGVASGGSFVNFGWALTPQPKVIPADGSTIVVFIDGAPVGTVDYSHFRADIATLFPGLANTNGAIGFRVIDTTTMTDGVHTIAWGVTDSSGAADGIGSRYFTVSNGAGAASAGALTAALARQDMGADRSAGDVRQFALNAAPLEGRRGWDPEAPMRLFHADDDGRTVIRGEELDRFELQLSPGSAGFLRVGSELAPLPIGSKLDAGSGLFTWHAGVGFVGTYDLVFAENGGARREVRVVLAAKGSQQGEAQIVIDTPGAQRDVGQPFMVAGWAADLNAEQGTGISTVHVWAYPLTGRPPIFLGAAEYGGRRPDVAASHGLQFELSGYGLVVQGLEPGIYDIAVFGWSAARKDFLPASTVQVVVR